MKNYDIAYRTNRKEKIVIARLRIDRRIIYTFSLITQKKKNNNRTVSVLFVTELYTVESLTNNVEKIRKSTDNFR